MTGEHSTDAPPPEMLSTGLAPRPASERDAKPHVVHRCKTTALGCRKVKSADWRNPSRRKGEGIEMPLALVSQPWAEGSARWHLDVVQRKRRSGACQYPAELRQVVVGSRVAPATTSKPQESPTGGDPYATKGLAP